VDPWGLNVLLATDNERSDGAGHPALILGNHKDRYLFCPFTVGPIKHIAYGQWDKIHIQRMAINCEPDPFCVYLFGHHRLLGIGKYMACSAWAFSERSTHIIRIAHWDNLCAGSQGVSFDITLDALLRYSKY
jgi:hypothetical protein